MHSGNGSPQLRPPPRSAISDIQDEPRGEVVWNARHETILKEWAEQSICYQKMHETSHRKFSRMNIQLTLPVIVMSTITGTANFSLASFNEEWRVKLPIVIGAINIASGMITTIAQYLRVSERSEGHRVAALAYGKLARNIGSELNLPRGERATSGLPLVRVCRTEMDRLEEQSPDIDADVVAKFESTHADVDLARPSIVDIHPITVYTAEETADERVANVVANAASALLGRRQERPITRAQNSEEGKVDIEMGGGD